MFAQKLLSYGRERSALRACGQQLDDTILVASFMSCFSTFSFPYIDNEDALTVEPVPNPFDKLGCHTPVGLKLHVVWSLWRKPGQ